MRCMGNRGKEGDVTGRRQRADQMEGVKNSMIKPNTTDIKRDRESEKQ